MTSSENSFEKFVFSNGFTWTFYRNYGIVALQNRAASPKRRAKNGKIKGIEKYRIYRSLADFDIK